MILFGSVAISADGDCVAIGTVLSGGEDVRFWKNAKSRNPSIPGDTNPTWTSVDLGGSIYKRCLDISDDGNYVVACGGLFVFYWADAKSDTKSGSGISWTWRSPNLGTALAVDLSSDGDYVATGGDAYVAYWMNARILTGDPQAFDWKSTKPTDRIVDVAISDDGNYVAAAGLGFPSPVYYWANAKNPLSSDPSTTWESAAGVNFSSIDMSSDGDSVIAGAIGTTPGVYFWDGARGESGTPSPSWTFPTTYEVEDVAINSAGDYMAAANDFAASYVYFLDNKGNSLWNPPYQLDMPVSSISISSDGGTLAVGTGGIDSDYLFNTGYPMKPVGGVAVPTDKLALLSPWIGIALAAVAVGVFVTRRRRKA